MNLISENNYKSGDIAILSNSETSRCKRHFKSEGSGE